MRYKTLLLSLLLVGAALGAGWWGFGWREEFYRRARENEARELLAFQSLAARLPKGTAIPLTKGFSKDAENRWQLIENHIDRRHDGRSTTLKELHEKTRDFFVKSEGFGAERRIVRQSDVFFLYPPGDLTIKQPGMPAAFPISSGETPYPTVKPAHEHYALHRDSLVDFVNAFGFGYVKDRDNVSGFKPHRFSDYIKPSPPWKVDHVLLVGILLHDKPLVYLSDNLPSMEQLRKANTRSLDSFEQAGIQSLRDGEDLYLIQKDDTLRMLGALRATKQCLKCHDAQRGDMLGAFSYTLRRVDKKD